MAGDISIRNILELVIDQKISDSQYSFLIDGKGNILAHPHQEYASITEPINIKAISEKLASAMLQNKAGIMPITLERIAGYVAYQPIVGTNWRVGSFISRQEYIKTERQI